MQALIPSNSGSWRPVVVLGFFLSIALVFRVYLASWKGHLIDLQYYQTWALDAGEFNVPYEGFQPWACDYPPVFPSLLKLLRWSHRSLGLPGDFTLPLCDAFDPECHRPILVTLKLPAIVSELAGGILLFVVGRYFRKPWSGVGLASLYLFNPVILYAGAYYGQADTVLLVFLLGSVAAFLMCRPAWLGAMVVGSVLVKAQALFLVPVVVGAVAMQWKTRWRQHWRRLAAGSVACFAFVFCLAWFTGQLPQFAAGYSGIVGFYPKVTMNAMNLWWLVTRPWDKPPVLNDFPLDTEHLFGLVSYRSVGAALFLGAVGLILWRLYRKRCEPYAVVLATAAAGWAFFNLPTEMHERYSVPAIGLMCLLPLWRVKWIGITLLASMTTMINIAYVAPLYLPPCPHLVRAVNWFTWPERQAVWTVIAVIHVLMLVVVLESLCRSGGHDSRVGAEALRLESPEAQSP